MKWGQIAAGRIAAGLVGVAAISVWVTLAGCDRSQQTPLRPTPLAERLERRAYPGSPPVIPHPPLAGATCTTCHTATGKVVPTRGVAPANPHTETPGLSDQARCRQCHLFQETDETFVESEFATVWGKRRGDRAHPEAPPVIPHHAFMREDCNACHSGPASPPAIRCDHAERMRCQQCHVQRDSETQVLAGKLGVDGTSTGVVGDQ